MKSIKLILILVFTSIFLNNIYATNYYGGTNPGFKSLYNSVNTGSNLNNSFNEEFESEESKELVDNTSEESTIEEDRYFCKDCKEYHFYKEPKKLKLFSEESPDKYLELISLILILVVVVVAVIKVH